MVLESSLGDLTKSIQQFKPVFYIAHTLTYHVTTSSQAIEKGYLKVASGGEQGQAALGELHPHRKQLLHWHASIAKNAAAEFAVAQELQRGTNLRNILLCNLDGDNIMLPNFPTSLVSQTCPRTCIFN